MLDTTAPELISLSVEPTVDLASGNSSLSISAITKPDESGIQSVVLYLDRGLTYSFQATSPDPNGTYSTIGFYGGWEDFTAELDIGLFL